VTKVAEGHQFIKGHALEWMEKSQQEGLQKALTFDPTMGEEQDLINGQPIYSTMGPTKPPRGGKKNKSSVQSAHFHDSICTTCSNLVATRQKCVHHDGDAEVESLGDIPKLDLPNEQLSPISNQRNSKRQQIFGGSS